MHADCSAIVGISGEFVFPDGVSVVGELSQFQTQMGGFDGRSVDNNLAVEELYSKTKVTLLRMYILTKRNVAFKQRQTVDASVLPDLGITVC